MSLNTNFIIFAIFLNEQFVEELQKIKKKTGIF